MIETKVQLSIISEHLTGVEISKILGVEASQIINKGEFLKNGKIVKRIPELNNRWILKSTLDVSSHLEEHLKDILSKLKKTKSNFLKLEGFTKNILFCGIYFTKDSQTDYSISFYLEKQVIKDFSDLNIEISYETYIL